MKTFRLTSSVMAGLLGALAFVNIFSQAAGAEKITRYVAPGGSCGGANPCYTNIQEAVNAANSGDEIRVAAGIYTNVYGLPRQDILSTGLVTQALYLSKTVSIEGGYTTTNWTVPEPMVNPTTLDAENKGRALYITGNIAPTIAGLRLMRGNSSGQGGGQGNSNAGGVVYVITASATLVNNTIISGTGGFEGGGVYLINSPTSLMSNTISGNKAGYGSGVCLESSAASVAGNLIAENAPSNGYGGGIAILYNGTGETLVFGNRITHNRNYLGGGVYLLLSNAIFRSNLIISNTASIVPSPTGNGKGGGIYISSGSPTFVNNLITDNYADLLGSGVYLVNSTPRFIHTTIARNFGGDGSGLNLSNDYSLTNQVALTNTILVYQTVGITVSLNSTARLDGVLWFNNGRNTGGAGLITITHAITGTPAFEADGYHLTSSSAAIDAGVNAGVTDDIDEDKRMGIPDLGADEWWPKIYLPLVRRN